MLVCSVSCSRSSGSTFSSGSVETVWTHVSRLGDGREVAVPHVLALELRGRHEQGGKRAEGQLDRFTRGGVGRDILGCAERELETVCLIGEADLVGHGRRER